MDKNLKEALSQKVSIGIVIVLIGCLIFIGYQYVNLRNDSDQEITQLKEALQNTQDALSKAKGEKTQLELDLEAEKERVGAIADEVGKITGTVGNLEKLSKLESELLQKYSKVYFLNEHYTPKSLRNIPLEHLYDESVNKQIDSRAWPFLKDLIEDAQEDDITLWIVSAYRSFGTQSSLKASYTFQYGSGANTFSADQGYSEHQLGTTVDFTTKNLGGGLDGFGNTEAYQWLKENAYKYGFILSYPENNAYYVFEPWHWRFVGQDLARDLHNDGKNFYSLPQREIDQYLLEIFD